MHHAKGQRAAIFKGPASDTVKFDHSSSIQKSLNRSRRLAFGPLHNFKLVTSLWARFGFCVLRRGVFVVEPLTCLRLLGKSADLPPARYGLLQVLSLAARECPATIL